MPASYLQRHRPICAVIAEIRALAEQRGDNHTIALCDEAREYAERMSDKLVYYHARFTKPPTLDDALNTIHEVASE